MSTEWEIQGNTYTCMKLDAFSQLTLSRKGAPLFLGVYQPDEDVQSLRAVYSNTLDVIASLPEDDFNALIKATMPYVRIKQDQNWAAIYNKSTNTFQFDFISAGVLVELLLSIMMEYLPDFFKSLDAVLFITPKAE